jgi:hypothetical protein
MTDYKYTMLSKDTRTISSLFIAGDYQRSYTVGRYEVTKISAVDEQGEMAYVPWFEVWKGDRLLARINASYVSEVFYQEGQP